MTSLYLKKDDRLHLRRNSEWWDIEVIDETGFVEIPDKEWDVYRFGDNGELERVNQHGLLHLSRVIAAQSNAKQLDGAKHVTKIVDSESLPEKEGKLPVTVEMKPMDEVVTPAVGPVPIDEAQIQDIVGRLARPMFQAALTQMYDEMDRRGKDLLGQMRKETTGHKMVAAVQINDAAIAKLTKEAHPDLITAILYIKSGLHPLLVGPSGCGKTFLAEQLAESLKLQYGHLTFNAGVSETWLYGRQLPGGFVEGSFSKLYREGGVFLADEVDAADSNLMLTLNTALANNSMYNPMNGETYKKHDNFFCIGAANTFGKGGDSVYTGRNRLDATTLDRFTILMVDYDAKVEKTICPDEPLRKKLQTVRKKLKDRGSKEIVSYRAFDKAFRLKTVGGYEMKDVMRILTASWPDNLAHEVGATAE